MDVTPKMVQLVPRSAQSAPPTPSTQPTQPTQTPQQVADSLCCKFVHPTMMGDGNLLIQFINHNCHDSATIIGGIRLKVSEPAKIPSFIAQHEGPIKAHAIAILQKHLRENQCPLGMNEALSADDYSLSFMIASLSSRGQALHPNRRNEGPMFYCLFDNLIEEVVLNYVEMDQDNPKAFIVNAYIHLVDAPRRRNALLKKNKAETKEENAPAPATTQEYNRYDRFEGRQDARRPRITPLMQAGLRRPPYPFPSQAPELQNVQDQLKSLAGMVSEMKQNLNPPGQVTQATFPTMPTAATIHWPPTDNLPSLPGDE